MKKKYRVDLKFNGYGISPFLFGIHIHNYHGNYGYVEHTGTEDEFDAIFDKLNNKENELKIIGIHTSDL